MTFLRRIGLYLLGISFVLLLSSLWQTTGSDERLF